MRKKTNQDYEKLATKRGFSWIGPTVQNVSTKTRWKCSRAHKWEAKYNDISNGSGCPYCSGKASKRPQDYQTLAESKGFFWLGPAVPNVKTNTQWRCPKGHVWEAPYGRISIGQGCPNCSHRIPKTENDYIKLAQERSFNWNGPLPANTSIKTNWTCSYGHFWEATYSSIQQGSGCPTCYGNTPKAPEDYNSLAKSRCFLWLGPTVPNTERKTNWKCEFGHEWSASFHNIQSGSSCPTCSKNLVAEQRRKTPEDYNQLAADRGFEWLGPIVSRNNSKTYWKCALGHKWQADFSRIQQGSGCPHCYGTANKQSDDYSKLAEEKGFIWEGPEVSNTKTNTNWRCPQNHNWEAPYTTIQSGHGCPHCAGLIPKSNNDYLQLAKDRGFKWIGPEVPNTKTNTNWECPEGHKWSANFHNIQGGTGCPECIDMVYGQRVSKAQRALSVILGGHLNFPFGRLNIDIALIENESKIAIEYDSWYWHAHKQEEDAERDKLLNSNGWKVLRIKTNCKLPDRSVVENAIGKLKGGEKRIEIILDDWGFGPSRFEGF